MQRLSLLALLGVAAGGAFASDYDAVNGFQALFGTATAPVTAASAGTQGAATALNCGLNLVTSGAATHSVKMPPDGTACRELQVRGEDVNSFVIFPESGDTINRFAADQEVRYRAASNVNENPLITCVGRSASAWSCTSQGARDSIPLDRGTGSAGAWRVLSNSSGGTILQLNEDTTPKTLQPDVPIKYVDMRQASTTLDCANTNDQTLWTCPTGSTACVTTRILVRDCTSDLTTCTSAFGWNTGATDVKADTSLTALNGTTTYMIVSPDNNAAKGAASGTFKANPGTTEAGDSCTADVFGYFY